MLDNFEPQEKKAIIIFIALLALGLVYVGTHKINWEKTEEKFENTLELIEQLSFSYLHVFPYSPRRGTEAHQLKDNIPGNIKKQRSQALKHLVATKAFKFREQFAGQSETVLIENQRDTKSGLLKGHTGNYIPVMVAGPDSLKNNLVPVTLQRVSEHQVTGCVR